MMHAYFFCLTVILEASWDAWPGDEHMDGVLAGLADENNE